MSLVFTVVHTATPACSKLRFRPKHVSSLPWVVIAPLMDLGGSPGVWRFKTLAGARRHANNMAGLVGGSVKFHD